MRLSCRTYCILLALSIGLGIHAESIEALCGTWIELRAKAAKDWHFDHWNDGDTSAVRQVEVLSNAHYIAFFASECEDYANLPVVSLYDWLLMLDVRSVQAMGYWFGEKDVSWYRVRGEPDRIDGSNGYDDAFVCRGYYLTLDKNLNGTGDYYAVVDVSASPSGVLCTGYMRSVLVHLASPAPQRSAPFLTPIHVPRRGQLFLAGLPPDLLTTVTMYDIGGRPIGTYTSSGSERFVLTAPGVSGCYMMIVKNDEGTYILRYVVH